MATIQQLKAQVDATEARHNREATRREPDPSSPYRTRMRRSWSSPLELARAALDDAATAREAGQTGLHAEFVNAAGSAIYAAQTYRKRRSATTKEWQPRRERA